MCGGLIDGRRNIKKTAIQAQNRRRAMAEVPHQERDMADGDGDLEVPWGLLLGIYQMGIPAT
jgi:hypothetical protein